MIQAIPILLAIICTSAAAEDIYRDVDEEGVPSFSDQQLPSSEKIEVRETVTFSDPVIKRRLKKASENKEPNVESMGYELVITEPTSGSAVRDNTGSLTLTASIEPSLRIGHKAELLMDDLVIRRLSSSGPVSLSNIDRGTHEFLLRVVDADGEVVSEGPSSSINMLRFSKLHRAN